MMLVPRLFSRHRMMLVPRLLALGWGLFASPAFGTPTRQDGEQPEDREIQAAAPDRPKDMPLAVLPEPRSIDLPAPRPAALEAIDELLRSLTDPDPAARASAHSLLSRARTDWVSGLERRVNRLAERSDRQKMKALFERIIKQERPSADPVTADYLRDVMAYPEPADPTWRDLVQLLALNRMLTAAGTTDAARVLIFVYTRFGEFIRIDCQRQLEAIGDRAAAALIDARRHPAPKIASWAERLLSLKGASNPHDVVRTDDSTALAEILVALGRSRDPELTNLLLSFAASDREGVRRAAREGLVLLGEIGAWQLKDAYLNITGKLPPRDWTWKRTARELFTEYDRLELEEAYALLARGERALADKKYADMARSFNEIVARVPSFQEPEKLALGYLNAARAVQLADPTFAIELSYRAEQLFSNPEQKNEAEALRRLLDAEQLRKRGWIDQTELGRAQELDPSLGEASTKLSRSSRAGLPWGTTSRYVVAAMVSVLSLLTAAWIFLSTWWKRGRSSGTAGPLNEK